MPPKISPLENLKNPWTTVSGSTQIRRLAGGLGQALSAQVLPRVTGGGAVSRRSVQHEVLGAGRGDDAWRQQNVDDRLQQQEYFRLL